MEINKIKERLSQLNSIAEKWSDENNISSIEKDIFLGKLREIYESILFEEKPVEILKKQIIAEEPEKPEEGNQKVIEEHKNIPIVEEKTLFEDTTEEEVKECVEEEIKIEEVINTNNIEEDLSVSELEDEDFDDESRQRLIDYLYGDNVSTVAFTESKPIEFEIENSVEKPQKKEPEVKKEEKQIKTISEAAEEKHIEILGETMNLRKDTIDMASKLQHITTTSLKNSIGLNDRFLIINELFMGNAGLYEEAINKLDEFTDLNDALIYIEEKYHWNPSLQATNVVINMLSRKLE